jgi:hypothetical protein
VFPPIIYKKCEVTVLPAARLSTSSKFVPDIATTLTQPESRATRKRIPCEKEPPICAGSRAGAGHVLEVIGGLDAFGYPIVMKQDLVHERRSSGKDR